MHRRCGQVLLILCVLSAANCSAPKAEQDARSKPNIVLILADDLGYGDVHALNPRSRIATPYLDRIANEGASFVDAHTPSSVCTPTRYGLLTGRYCWRSRLKRGVLNGYSPPLIEAGRPTVAKLLQAGGYQTAIFGKWHLGLSWPRVDEEIDFTQQVKGIPNENGFHTSFIIPASLDFPPYVYLQDGRVTAEVSREQPGQGFPAYLRKGPIADDLVMDDALDRIIEEANAWIRVQATSEDPFFVYLPLTAPHKPVLPQARFRGATDLGDYADFIVQVDAAVGDVLRTLEDAGVADDTLLIVTSDNGSFMYRIDDPSRPSHEQDLTVQGYHPEVHRANGLLRGTKADIWEAGHRVPFLVRWPGVVAAGQTRTETICLTDFYASCADLVDAAPSQLGGEDSFSLLPLFDADAGDFVRAPVIHHSASGVFAMRDGGWKLVAGNGSGGREQPRGTPFGEPYQLYQLDLDLVESVDRIADEAGRAQQMATRLEAIRAAGSSHGFEQPRN